ncbi:hypothetical protein [Streptomyces chilikensis]|uniref:Uncharacterized protein n=1 Tax=Streptomyces chilikensis TaxID=1194079 RepID=A0ABV3ERJ2_9ACTN
MREQPWTIESICDALGHPALKQDFLNQINRAPADELLNVFSKWEQKAERSLAATQRGREIAEAEDRGEDPPGEWADITESVYQEAQRIRSRGAA